MTQGSQAFRQKGKCDLTGDTQTIMNDVLSAAGAPEWHDADTNAHLTGPVSPMSD